MFFHKHKWGSVEKGYQYCRSCGEARCVHDYELIQTIKFEKGWDLGMHPEIRNHITYVSKCRQCGDIKTVVAQ